MCSSELRDDEYHFLHYTIEQYRRGNGPPLISKKSRLIAAATQNDFLTLKELLDSPKWYEVRDKLGLDLLQIAILRQNIEIFDYLLSLADFPLESVNDEGDTALIVALCYYVIRVEPQAAVSRYGLKALQGAYGNVFSPISQRYSYELIKKGANIDKITSNGDPLLHCALRRGFVSAAQLLIEKGADVNELDSHGSTPLSISAFNSTFVNEEAFLMLLCYGADPSIRDQNHRTLLDLFLLQPNDRWQVVQENLLYLTHDEWNLYKIDAKCLLQLAKNKSSVFHEVIKLTSEIIITDMSDKYCFLLFSIDLEYLRIFIEKYPYFVKAVLRSFGRDAIFLRREDIQSFSLKNLDMLLQSSLYSDVLEMISKLRNNFIQIMCLNHRDREPGYIIEVIYCLLSYGMPLFEKSLEDIYRVTGYSEDFKNLFFMDLQKRSYLDNTITNIIPRVIYDVTFDPHNSTRVSYVRFSLRDWIQLFKYFAHPKFQKIYRNMVCLGDTHNYLSVCSTRLPLLQELARDAFRKHFIKAFEIKTAKEFFSLIKLLPVPSEHKKIITFETKLY